jgi:hypothetical protein
MEEESEGSIASHDAAPRITLAPIVEGNKAAAGGACTRGGHPMCAPLLSSASEDTIICHSDNGHVQRRRGHGTQPTNIFQSDSSEKTLSLSLLASSAPP